MQIIPEQEEPVRIYSTMIRSITPRPIAWVSTVSPRGVTNLAPFSYFNGVCSRPATLSISVVNKPDGSEKDTLRNIRATSQFVVNLVPFALGGAMEASAAEVDYETSEFELAGVQPVPSQRVRPPGVQASPIRMECQTSQIVPVGEGPFGTHLVLGEILLIHIDESVLDEHGKVDPERLDTMGRMGPRTYCRTTDRFELP